jgi:succinate-acetate transporter protein
MSATASEPQLGAPAATTAMITWVGYFGLLTARAAGYAAHAVVTGETFGRRFFR